MGGYSERGGLVQRSLWKSITFSAFDHNTSVQEESNLELSVILLQKIFLKFVPKVEKEETSKESFAALTHKPRIIKSSAKQYRF